MVKLRISKYFKITIWIYEKYMEKILQIFYKNWLTNDSTNYIYISHCRIVFQLLKYFYEFYNVYVSFHFSTRFLQFVSKQEIFTNLSFITIRTTVKKFGFFFAAVQWLVGFFARNLRVMMLSMQDQKILLLKTFYVSIQL